MRFILVTILLILSFWSVESNDSSLSFYKALFKPPKATDDCIPLTNDYCPMVNTIHRTFPSGMNDLSLVKYLDSVPDDISLDDLLQLSLQLYVTYIVDNPSMQPDNAQSLVDDLVRLRDTLSEEGSSHIFWKDLKPLIRRIISPLVSQNANT